MCVFVTQIFVSLVCANFPHQDFKNQNHNKKTEKEKKYNFLFVVVDCVELLLIFLIDFFRIFFFSARACDKTKVLRE